MSDFLSQLTTRSRQADPTIRPRLAGLFEPLQSASSGIFPVLPTPVMRDTPGEFDQDREMFGPMPASAVAPVQFAAAVTAHSQPEPVPASATPPMASRFAQPLAPSGYPAVPASTGVLAGPPPAAAQPGLSLPRSPAQRAPNGGQATSPAQVRPAAHSVLPAASEPQPSAPLAASQHTPAAISVPRSQPPAASDASSKLQHTEAAPTRPAAQFNPVPAPPAPIIPSTRLTMPPAPPRQAVIAQPQVRPLAVPTPAPRRQELQRETAPAIQVTIGRVEVRAVPAETSARPARPASPALSLEDYLRQRNGGRR